jgi:hypothetical protein
MPRVPVYDRQAQVKTTEVGTRVISKPQPMGTEMAEAAGRAGAALMNTGNVLAQHMAERQKIEDERQVMERDTAARTELQDRLYKQDVDENGRPVGFLNRQKNHATGLTPEFDQTFRELKQKYVGSLANDTQKQLFSKMIDNHYEGLRGTVIRHEAEQGRELFKETVSSAVKQRISEAATISDPSLLLKAIDDAQGLQTGGLKRMGSQDDVVGAHNQVLAGELVKSSFGPLLSQDYRKAEAVLNAARSRVPADVAAEMDKALEGRKLEDERVSTWKQVAGHRLADGTPDTNRMQNSIFAREDLTTEKKEKLWDYVKVRAAEENQQRKQQEVATDHSFKNEVFAAKKGGANLDAALKLVSKYGGDEVAQQERTEIVKALYTTKTITDPVTYNKLWEGVQEGKMGKTELNVAFAQGKISSSDFMELTKTGYNALHKEDEFYKKEIIDRVKDLAQTEYGSNEKKRNGFLYSVLISSRGKTPEETWKIAQDLTKNDPSTGAFSFTQDAQWETNVKRSDAQNLVWGKLHQDIGQDQVKAIGQSALMTGKKTWGVSDVEEFATALGGYEKLKKGTPENTAIDSLVRKNKQVTPEAVKAVLKVHPDGVWK